MRLFSASIPLAALAALGGCFSDSAHHRGEEFSNYYRGPAEATTSERVERREILHWGADPKTKKRIGFLHKYETTVKGSRTSRESWKIFDRYNSTAIGFITEEGVFYRFNERGGLGERVGEYPVVTTGLKVFFGISVREHVDLEEIDPYK